MKQGRLIAVVGPSGVGKDSVMRGIHEAMPGTHLARRVITRAPDLGGEVYDSVTVTEFQDLADKGAFAVHWSAHGLCYGISKTVRCQVNQGTDCLANFSRKALLEGAEAFENFLVLNITARSETLARRLVARGRETATEIGKRLAEAEKTLPGNLHVITLSNDGDLSETVARAMALLQPEGFRQ